MSFLDLSRGCSTFVELLQLWAAERGDRPAYTFLPDGDAPARQLTFAELDRRARAIAAYLQAHGHVGQRALLMYPNGLDFVATFLGCAYAGTVPVPTPLPAPPFEKAMPRIRGIVRSCAPRLIISNSSTLASRAAIVGAAPELSELHWIANDAIEDGHADSWQRCERDAGSLALLQYTSGSTTSPRAVRVTEGNLLQSCSMMDRAWRHREDSVMVSWLPTFHDMGLVYGMLTPLFKGFHCVMLTPQSFVRRPLRWLEAFTRYRGTHTMAPNFGYDLCLRKIAPADCAEIDLASWRVAASGAEPIRKDTVAAFAERFAPFGLRAGAMINAYGLAESTLAVTGTLGGAMPTVLDLRRADLEQGRIVIGSGTGEQVRAVVSVGAALADTAIEIVDPETCRRAAADRVGEIWVGGPTVAAGYLELPEDTERTFAARIEDDGAGPFLRTGDLGFVRDRELYICGRLKDLIILRGRNHHPADLEATVEHSHRGIRLSSTAAIAVDTNGSEELVLLVELERDVADDDLLAIEEQVRRDIAFHHDVEPAEVVFLETGSVPKTSSGKLRRGDARRQYEAGALSRRTTPCAVIAPPAGSALLDDLRTEVARLARKPELVTDDVVVHRLGLDSVKLAELAAFLERKHGIVVATNAFYADVTLAELARRLRKTRDAPADAHTPDAPRTRRAPVAAAPRGTGVDLSLFFFADDSSAEDNRYRLLVESSRIADAHGFHAVWIPERHFHPFGGVYPNPAVAASALATITSRIRLRAGSVVLPLHDPLRVVEEWSLVDNLSNGRVDLAFASGWAANDFVLMPQNYAERRRVNLDGIDTIKRLWAGEALTRPNGVGEPFAARVFPQPVQPELATWLTCTGGIDGFVEAGVRGHHVLTALLFQTIEELAAKITVYRAARAASGRDPAEGRVTVMLHTFVGAALDTVREQVRAPFLRYLRSSINLWRNDFAHLANLSGPVHDAALEAAFERYASRNSLFGTPASCLETLRQMHGIGVSEVACLIDFGVATDTVLEALAPLDELRRAAARLGPETAP